MRTWRRNSIRQKCKQMKHSELVCQHLTNLPSSHMNSNFFLRLNFIGEVGIDKDKVKAFMESLPPMITPTGDRDTWWRYIRQCLTYQHMHVPFNPAQQAVSMLSCFKIAIFMKCAVGNLANLSCRRAYYFHRFRFSKDNPELDSRVVWRRCARQVTADFTKLENTNPDFCSDELERAAAIGVCVLRETGHVSGDVVNMTALRESIERQGEWVDDPLRHLELQTITDCKHKMRVDDFAHCYVYRSWRMGIDKVNYELAMALPQPAPVWP